MEKKKFNNCKSTRKLLHCSWTRSEKKKLLKILEKYGPDDVHKFQNVLPMKSKRQITRYLNCLKKSAQKKLKQKHYYYTWQNRLEDVHQWLPFINVNFNSKITQHNYLIAYILPFIQKYAIHPSSSVIGNVDFRLACLALFNSLINVPFPENMNNETLAMIYTSLHHLITDVKKENSIRDDILKHTIKKCLNKTDSFNLEVEKIDQTEVLKFPETNVFGWTRKEIDILCKKC